MRKSNLQRPFIQWIFIIILVIPLFPQQAAAEEVFSDVSPKNDHYKGILDSYENGFISGYPDDTFKPYVKLTRGHVVKALGKLVLAKTGATLADFDFSNAEPFSDVPATYSDRELYEYSLIVKEAGIFSGSNNRLLPKNYITRQQMAKVLVNAFNLDHKDGVKSAVTDNKFADDAFRDYIDVLSVNNVTSVSTFRPRDTVNRGQFATFLSNANLAFLRNVKENSDLINPDNILDEKEEEEPATKPATPVSIVDLLPMRLSTASSASHLPKQVEVIYSDGDSKNHDVNWDLTGVDMKTVGKYTLTGQVVGTNLKTKLELEMIEFTFMYYTPQLILVIPETSDAYKKAVALIGSLPNDIKNADNALNAAIIWGKAKDAVEAVKDELEGYSTTTQAWDNILDEQYKVIEKRQSDINKAKAAATVATDELLNNIKRTKSYTEAQNIVNDASLKLTTYKNLDKKSDTTQLTNKINSAQNLVNDMKTVETIAKQTSVQILEPKSSKPLVYPKLPTIEAGVSINFSPYFGGLKTNRERGGYWSLSRPFFEASYFSHVRGFKAEISKGNVTYNKYFFVYVPETKMFKDNDPATLSIEFDYAFK